MRADAQKYLCGALSDGRQAAFADHLQRCPRCAMSVRRQAQAIALLHDIPPPVPPADLAGRIKAAARLQAVRLQPSLATRATRRRPALNGLVTAAAAATGIAGLCGALLLHQTGLSRRAPVVESSPAPSLAASASPVHQGSLAAAETGPGRGAAAVARAGAAVAPSAQALRRDRFSGPPPGAVRFASVSSARPARVASRTAAPELPTAASLRSPVLRIAGPGAAARAGMVPAGRASFPVTPAAPRATGSASVAAAPPSGNGSARAAGAPAAGDGAAELTYPAYAEVAGGLAAAALLTRYVEKSIVSGDGAVVSLAVSAPATRGPEAVQEWGTEAHGR